MDNTKALISESWLDYAYIEVAVPGSKFTCTRGSEPIKASMQNNALLVLMEGSNLRKHYDNVAEKGIYMFPFESMQYCVLVPDEYYDPKPEGGIGTPDGPAEPIEYEVAWPLRIWKKIFGGGR